MNPFFSNVNPMSEKVILVDGEKIIADDTNIVQFFNAYFINTTESLRLSVPDNNDFFSVSNVGERP